jgi:hypothetical protein
MFNNQTLVLDTHCEVYDLLKPWTDGEFWNLQEHIENDKLIPGAIYLIGRQQFSINIPLIRQLVTDNVIKVILSNPAEGSDTIRTHCDTQFHIVDLVKSKKILVIGGGDMDLSWPCLQYDSFLPKLYDYTENLEACARSNEIYNNKIKPYKFLFLNGRGRSHRRQLIAQLAELKILDYSLWTNLDTVNGPIKYLPQEYECNFYQSRINLPTTDSFVKHSLFNNTWGEIYLKAEPYIDTYFSLITETVYNYPYSFRTEKIWKPVAMCHPWIAVANRGYYRDMHNLGFKTFQHVIDESFDQIDHNSTRLERIVAVVNDLCQQDLAKFLEECYTVCKYNQQHLEEMRIKVRKEFPDRFFQFIEQYNFS